MLFSCLFDEVFVFVDGVVEMLFELVVEGMDLLFIIKVDKLFGYKVLVGGKVVIMCDVDNI